MKVIRPKAETRAIITCLQGNAKVKTELMGKLSADHFGYRPMHAAFRIIEKMLIKSALDLPSMETFLEFPDLTQETADLLKNPDIAPITKVDDAKRLIDILEQYRVIRRFFQFSKDTISELEGATTVDIPALMGDMEMCLSDMRSEADEAPLYHVGKGANDAESDVLMADVFSSEVVPLIPSNFANFDTKAGGFGHTDLFIPASHKKGGKCVAAGTLIETALGLVPIESLFDGTEKDDEFTPLDLQVADRYGTAVATHKFTKWHEGTMSLRSRKGFTLTGSHVHPVLVMDSLSKSLQYKHMQDLLKGDFIVLNKKHHLFPSDMPKFNWEYTKEVPDTLVCQVCGSSQKSMPAHLAKAHKEVDREEYKKPHHSEMEKWPRVHDTTRRYDLPKNMSVDLAMILGYLMAEGQQTSNFASFSQADTEVLEDFCVRFERAFPGVPFSVEPEKENPSNKRVWIRSKCVSEFLQYLGLNAVHSRDKVVPWVIFKSPKECVSAFLRAYFEGDGGGEKKKLITCTSASPTLINSVQQLLLRFGVVSGTREKKSRATNGSQIYKTYHTLKISRDSVTNFLAEIGFVTDRKMKSTSDTERKTDIIPFVAEAALYVRKNFMTNKSGWYKTPEGVKRLALHITYNARQTKKSLRVNPSLLEGLNHFYPELVASAKEAMEQDFYFDEIVEIKETKEKVKLYDLSVPGSHSYIANGMVVHNSILTLNMTVNMYQLNNVDVIYIPLEMNKQETAERLISLISGVEHKKIRTKDMSSTEVNVMQKAWRTFKAHGLKNNCRFTVWPASHITVPQLRLKLKPFKYKVIVIDYINLLDHPQADKLQEWQKLNELARELKLLTKDLNALIIAPTQMNEDGTLRYARGLAEHANTVWTWTYGEEEQQTHIITIDQPAVRSWAPFKFQLREDFSRMVISDHLGGDPNFDSGKKTKMETMKGFRK